MNTDVPIILVVEDDQSIQGIVEVALSDGGFEAAIATSGEEAVTLLEGKRTKYRVLVTDINLPGKMNGWEIAQHAREIEPEFPIIYMSGMGAADWPSKGVPKSIMLEKPFAPAQLVTAIANLLNNGAPHRLALWGDARPKPFRMRRHWPVADARPSGKPFGSCHRSCCMPGKPPHAGFHSCNTPRCCTPPNAVQHDTDLLFRRILPARLTSDVLSALQLLCWDRSESMGNHDSDVVDASSVD